MSTAWDYRIVVYLLDLRKRKVLLMKAVEAPFEGKLMPFTFPLSKNRFPQQLIQDYFKKTFKIDVEFIFHDTSLPAVLDKNTIQTIAPFFTQVTNAGPGRATIDFVYLAFSKRLVKLNNQGFRWCHAEDLVGRVAPKHVKRTAKHILKINQK